VRSTQACGRRVAHCKRTHTRARACVHTHTHTHITAHTPSPVPRAQSGPRLQRGCLTQQQAPPATRPRRGWWTQRQQGQQQQQQGLQQGQPLRGWGALRAAPHAAPVCVYVCTCVCVCVSACIYAHVSTCAHVYVCVCDCRERDCIDACYKHWGLEGGSAHRRIAQQACRCSSCRQVLEFTALLLRSGLFAAHATLACAHSAATHPPGTRVPCSA